MATVAARESEVIEQPRNTLIEHGAIVTAGLVAERRGEPALADAGRAADQQVGMVIDPAALCQSACKIDPRSASNFDPLRPRVLAVALAASELVGVAKTSRARVGT